jgi:hypothetical protein
MKNPNQLDIEVQAVAKLIFFKMFSPLQRAEKIRENSFKLSRQMFFCMHQM